VNAESAENNRENTGNDFLVSTLALPILGWQLTI